MFLNKQTRVNEISLKLRKFFQWICYILIIKSKFGQLIYDSHLEILVCTLQVHLFQKFELTSFRSNSDSAQLLEIDQTMIDLWKNVLKPINEPVCELAF